MSGYRVTCAARPLGRFRVPGVVARRPATPPSARTSRGLRVRQLSALPEQRSDRQRATSSPRRSWRIGRLPAFQMLWGPGMGANVFRRPQPQRDVARLFSQVRSSRFDSVRRWQAPRNSLTRKRSLVQIQYGPRSVTWHFLSGSYQVALCGSYNWSCREGERMPRPTLTAIASRPLPSAVTALSAVLVPGELLRLRRSW